MVCVKSQCKCDSKTRLFWTGARCTSCPNEWTMTGSYKINAERNIQEYLI